MAVSVQGRDRDRERRKRDRGRDGERSTRRREVVMWMRSNATGISRSGSLIPSAFLSKRSIEVAELELIIVMSRRCAFKPDMFHTVPCGTISSPHQHYSDDRRRRRFRRSCVIDTRHGLHCSLSH